MKTRRDFIKISSLGLGAVALAPGQLNIFEGSQANVNGNASGQLFRTPTYCEICFWKCAGWTYVNEKNEIIKVEGNDDDLHCNGRLCPRGTGGVGSYYDDDRLTKPLIRMEKDGKQTFREASWDEALDLIARRLREIKQEYGPECVALIKHGSSGDHFKHLFEAYGTDNITHPSYAQCRGPRSEGFKLTFGEDPGSPEQTDIRDTKCLVLIGSHLGENMHNGQVQEMAMAIDKGASIITVDPRYSTAASKSKYWLPIKPATDIALLLAWIHVIIEEGLYDKRYVDFYTTGFDKLKQHVQRMTPEWAYGITTIKPDIIRKTAREMAKAAPAAIVHPGRHVTWYGDDVQRSRAIAILNALLGSWGRRGGFFLREGIKVPDYPHPKAPKPRWNWKDGLNGQYPLASQIPTNVIIDQSIPGNVDDKYRTRAWFVTGTNLPMTLPDKPTFLKAANSVDFIVVVDTMPMEITGFADVVLPECTYLERYDTIRNSPHREPNIALRMPAVEPLGDSKPARWMARELAVRLGLEEYFHFENYEDELDWQLKQLGSSLDEMKRIGVRKFERTEPLYFTEGMPYRFKTPSGKIELYSEEMKSLGFDPLPVYVAHEEPPQGYYRLNYGRAPMHTFGRTANNPNLVDLMSENSVWVNPKVASIWGLKTGQKVWLKNQDGIVSSFPIKVRVTERIRWDSVYMVHGFGHNVKDLKRAFGNGANDSELITNVKVDPMMGGTGMRANFVTFLKNNPAT
jgi:thiosulfate reductase/polysulfide reductase chain A